MLLTEIIQRINTTIINTKTFNLTNEEEKTLTIELVSYLKKLNKLILTPKEINQLTKKTKIIQNKKSIIRLYQYLFNNHKKRSQIWIPWLSIKSNILLNISNILDIKEIYLYSNKILLKNLNKIISTKQYKTKKSGYIYLENTLAYTTSEIENYLAIIEKKIMMHTQENWVIPSKCIFIENMPKSTLATVKEWLINQNGKFIIDIYSQDCKISCLKIESLCVRAIVCSALAQW